MFRLCANLKRKQSAITIIKIKTNQEKKEEIHLKARFPLRSKRDFLAFQFLNCYFFSEYFACISWLKYIAILLSDCHCRFCTFFSRSLSIFENNYEFDRPFFVVIVVVQWFDAGYLTTFYV